MATAESDPELVRLAVNALFGKLKRDDFELRPEETLEQVFRSVALQLQADVKLMLGQEALRETATPKELGMTGKVHLSVERLGYWPSLSENLILVRRDCSHYHRSPKLEINCPVCCKPYSEEHAPVKTGCGHWVCLGCYEVQVRRSRDTILKGIRCLLHPERFMSLRWEEGKPIATWLLKDLPLISTVAVKCQSSGCKKDAVWICPDGCGAQCEEHSRQLHSLLANHAPVPIDKSTAVGESGTCMEHGKKLKFAMEAKAEDGSVAYQMCCPECLSSEEAVHFSGKNLDKLAGRLKESLASLDFSAKYKAGIDRCLELENRFKEVVGDGENLGSIDEAVKRIRRFYAGLKAKLDENCRAMEAQVAKEAEKRIAVLQRLHSQTVEAVSRVQHAMVVHGGVSKDAAPHEVVWCHNRVAEAKQGEYPSMREAPPSSIEVVLPEPKAETVVAECIGEVLPPRPSAPVDLAVSVSDSGVVDARWASHGTAAGEEFEVVLESSEDATAGSAVSLYRGKDPSCRVDLAKLVLELKENGECTVQVRSVVEGEDGCLVSGKSGWAESAGFRVPVGALRHPVMVVVGGYDGVKRLASGLVLVGARGAGKTLSSVEGFDMVTRKWSDLAPLPKGSHGGACGAIKDILYSAMGYFGDCHTNTVWKSELGGSGLQWSPSTPMMTNHTWGGSVCRQDGSLWVLGGIDGSNYLSTVERWKPGEETWSSGPPMTVCQGQGLSAVELPDGRLVALGGDERPCNSQILEGETWSNLPDAPCEISYSASGVVHGRIFLAGGGLEEKALALDVRERSWTSLSPMTTARTHTPASVVWNEELYVAGGYNGLNSMEVYDPRANAWRLEEAAMKQGRHYASACLAARMKM